MNFNGILIKADYKFFLRKYLNVNIEKLYKKRHPIKFSREKITSPSSLERIKFYYYKDFVGHYIISSQDSKSLIGAHVSRTTRPFAVIYHTSTIIRAYSRPYNSFRQVAQYLCTIRQNSPMRKFWQAGG